MNIDEKVKKDIEEANKLLDNPINKDDREKILYHLNEARNWVFKTTNPSIYNKDIKLPIERYKEKYLR